MEYSLKDAIDISNNIDGWLTPDESAFLFNTAKMVPSHMSIIEIGAWKGKSTVLLGLGSLNGNNARVISIDPHTGSPEQQERYGEVDTLLEWKNNVTKLGLQDIITPHVMTSNQASYQIKSEIGMVFVDGDHDYDMVKLDFEIWFPRLQKGGVFALHDTEMQGPKKVADDFLLASHQSWKAGFVDTITYAYKTHHNDKLDRIRNRWVTFKRNKAEMKYYHAMGIEV